MRSKREVYIALVEVKPLPGCWLDPAECAGAFVRCYVAAHSADGALKRVRASLTDQSFELIGVEWCEGAESAEWENLDDPDGAELEEEALESGEVVFGEFHCWGHDAPDAHDRD